MLRKMYICSIWKTAIIMCFIEVLSDVHRIDTTISLMYIKILLVTQPPSYHRLTWILVEKVVIGVVALVTVSAVFPNGCLHYLRGSNSP